MDAPEGEEMESGERRGGFTFSIIPSQTDSPKVEGEMGCEVDYIFTEDISKWSAIHLLGTSVLG